ncbi:7714_t:CDS:2, partial [Paraglomus occultum]
EKAALRAYFTKNPTQEEKASTILPTFESIESMKRRIVVARYRADFLALDTSHCANIVKGEFFKLDKSTITESSFKELFGTNEYILIRRDMEVLIDELKKGPFTERTNLTYLLKGAGGVESVRVFGTMGLAKSGLKQLPSSSKVTMFDAAMEAAKDIQNSVVLFNFLVEDLQRTVRVPVVICIDQYNAFLVDHEAVLEYNKAPTTISWGSNPIGRIFSDWNNFNVQRGAVLFAFTSSYHGGKTAIDGNSRLFTRISPYNNDEWAKMTNRYTDSLPPDTGFLRNFVGGIPRELGRFMKIWAKERHNGVDNVMKLYTKDATDYYKERIQRLLDKKRMKEDVKESTVFAAKIFMGSPMDDVPDSWENSGMVVVRGQTCKLCCPAAELAIFKAFDDSHTKNAISILRGDKTISWRVLELCVQHRFRMAAMSANIVEMEYTDLTQKKEKEKIQISAQNIIIHNDIPVELPTIHPGTVYICWRGAAVVDFFIYNHDCKKIFLQVSEQPYAKHKTKLPDLFTTTITRHNLSVYDFFSKCIDETYDPSDRNSLDENDYYVYLTTSDSKMKVPDEIHKKVCLIPGKLAKSFLRLYE